MAFSRDLVRVSRTWEMVSISCGKTIRTAFSPLSHCFSSLSYYLEEVVFRVILNQVGVDPALPVGQAVSGDVQGVLRGLDGQLEAPDLRLQQLILA